MSESIPSSEFEYNAKKLREKNKVLYSRLLLKLSGEYFGGEKAFGFDQSLFENISKQIILLHQFGVEIAIVLGGGNIFRGAKSGTPLDRISADNIGMLATIMNGIYLQNVLENSGLKTRLMSSISLPTLAETYIRRRAVRHLEKGRIVIFGAGTGNPYFTTDTTAVLRGREINADIIVKCTNVDGVYDKDPKIHSDAVKYDTLDFDQALLGDLKVMDATAYSFSKSNNLNIYILNIRTKNSILDFVTGKKVGTLLK